MAGALRLLLIGCLLQGSLCQTFEAFMPQTIAVLSGSCVTIPCSFNIEETFKSDLDNTCTAIWKIGGDEVFGTSDPTEQQARQRLHGEVTGDLTKKDCTTTLNNMTTDYSGEYFFRLQCQNRMKYTFPDTTVNIVVEAAPPSPTLTSSRLEMKEGSSVSLSCSAAAPCPSLPPTLTWTPRLGNSQETLKENQDKTKVMTSVLTFTASRLHDGQTISCTALYNQQAGSKNLSAAASSTVSILFAPEILFSSGCIRTAAQINCSCETVGNPPPTVKWQLDGTPVNDSDKFTISYELLNDTRLRSFIAINQLQSKDSSILVCFSINSVGSASLLMPVSDYLMNWQEYQWLFIISPIIMSAMACLHMITIGICCYKVNHFSRLSKRLRREEDTYASLQLSAVCPEYDTLQVSKSAIPFEAKHLPLGVTHLFGGTPGCSYTPLLQQGAVEACSLCQTFEAFMPQTIAVLSGSCVTIPCSFNIAERFTSDLDNTCTAIWKIGGDEVFGTSDPIEQQARQRLHGEVTGDLTKKDCTTTLNNMTTDYSGEYFFRLQCQNRMKYTFPDTTVNIVVEAAPPSPTLTPSRLEVKEGSSVSLSCSAAAPCPSLPPTLTWTRRLGKSQETLKENQDKTKVMTSVLTFTASRLHDGQTISCTALYNQQAGSKNLSAAASSTVSILYAPRLPSVSVSPSGLVQAGSAVTLACRSDANPAVKYTWYRVDGDQKLVVGSENNVTLNNIDRKKKGPYMCEAKNAHGEANATVLLDFGFAPEILFSSGCIRTAAQINCSCETVGNPPPTVKWQLDGTPVNDSDKFTISYELLNDTRLRSFIAINQLQSKDSSILVCFSINSVGSASLLMPVSDYLMNWQEYQWLFIISPIIMSAMACLHMITIGICCYKVNHFSRLSKRLRREEDTYASLQLSAVCPEYDTLQVSKDPPPPSQMW
ncbi:B-cell receptor CD22-like [Centroberyx affinis]|uniref:B-cell receptor CD22-like n=1 Tax=Centroberyx affinis TaxID=166261 RepID=UPI003A5C70C0